MGKKVYTKDDWIEIAKDLYLSYTEKGERKYSFRDIATIIYERYKKQINYATISRWCKKYEWEQLDQDIKNLAAEKSIDDYGRDKDEKIKDKKSTELAEIFKLEQYKYKAANKLVTDLLKEQINEGKQHFSSKDLALLSNYAFDRLSEFMDLKTDKNKDLREVAEALRNIE